MKRLAVRGGAMRARGRLRATINPKNVHQPNVYAAREQSRIHWCCTRVDLMSRLRENPATVSGEDDQNMKDRPATPIRTWSDGIALDRRRADRRDRGSPLRCATSSRAPQPARRAVR
jgi:hypothetical protein